MATCLVKTKSGDSITVNHQFGTVRRNLNAAALKQGDDPSAFAEFNTDSGRVGVNPAEVESYSEVKE